MRNGTRVLRGLAVAAVTALALSSCSLFTSSTGTAPRDATVWFAFGLERDQQGLAEVALKRNSPGDADYRKFLTTQDITSQHGASEETSSSALKTLQEAGFDGSVDETGGLILGTFTVAEAEAFFGVGLDSVAGSNGSSQILPSQELGVPSALGDTVTEVFGGRATEPAPSGETDSTASSESSGASSAAEPSGSASPTSSAAASPAPSAQAAEDFPLPACPPPDPRNEGVRERISDLYGLEDLDKDGLTGAGVRVGLLEIDTYSPTAMNLFAKCFKVPLPKIEVVQTNATAPQLKKTSTESSIDIAALAVVAPGVSQVDLFQFDGNTSLVFPFSKVMDNQADPSSAMDILSTSIAFCATSVREGERQMSEWLLMSAAANGLPVLASAGDTGSSGCYPPNRDQNVQYPSESMYAISIGGTELERSSNNVKDSEAWNESPNQELAGGGGPSADFDRPDFQSTTGLDESMRQTPDVSFMADPADVGAIAVCNPGSPCLFEAVAGTSVTAPAFGGSLALLVEKYRKAGENTKLGWLNPAIYQLAGTDKRDSIFLDVTEGTIDLFDVGCCDAGPGYDMATGWGSLHLGEFATAYEALDE